MTLAARVETLSSIHLLSLNSSTISLITTIIGSRSDGPLQKNLIILMWTNLCGIVWLWISVWNQPKGQWKVFLPRAEEKSHRTREGLLNDYITALQEMPRTIQKLEAGMCVFFLSVSWKHSSLTFKNGLLASGTLTEWVHIVLSQVCGHSVQKPEEINSYKQVQIVVDRKEKQQEE